MSMYFFKLIFIDFEFELFQLGDWNKEKSCHIRLFKMVIKIDSRKIFIK